MDLILSFNQMWKQHPNVFTLYPDDNVYIICDTYELKISAVKEPCNPPLQLLRLQITYAQLVDVGVKVLLYPCMQTHNNNNLFLFRNI